MIYDHKVTMHCIFSNYFYTVVLYIKVSVNYLLLTKKMNEIIMHITIEKVIIRNERSNNYIIQWWTCNFVWCKLRWNFLLNASINWHV